MDLRQWLEVAGNAQLGPGLSYPVGDANLDGMVDGLDFDRWNNNKFTAVAAWCSGDFNADGSVDGPDFNLWNANRSNTAHQGNLPEPLGQGCLLLLATIHGMFRAYSKTDVVAGLPAVPPWPKDAQWRGGTPRS
jgi:hypothetical protein